jgi:hypothetical protein
VRRPGAPLDERDGNLLEGVNARSDYAASLQIFAITHVDVDPQFRNDLQPFIGAAYDERLYHFANR